MDIVIVDPTCGVMSINDGSSCNDDGYSRENAIICQMNTRQ
jgi:hypothetical protein